MKLKKILASIAAMAMSVTAFSSVAMATNSYGAPVVTAAVSGPTDYYGDGTPCIIVKMSYSGFTGFKAYARQSGVGLTSVATNLTYDTAALTFEEGLGGSSLPGSTPGLAAPTFQWGVTDPNMVAIESMTDYYTAIFSLKDGVDLSSTTLEFGYSMVEFGVAKAVKGQTTVNELYGNTNFSTDTVKADPFSYPEKKKTYTVTATSDVEVTGANISAPVAEGTKLNVAAKAKEGYTAKLLANGVEIAAGEYTVTGNVDFTVDYTAIVPANPHKYTLDDKGTCEKDTVKGIYYSLSVKNVADKLAIKVSDKVFEATGIPEVTGDTVSTLTYVILGVPDEIYNAVPALGGVTSGETVFDAE